MRRVFLRILVFVTAIDLFYMYIGQTVTQSEQHPPPELEITVETEQAELVTMGEALFENKGGCLICHKVTDHGNDRGPDLRNVGATAATRQPGKSAEEYLIESMLKPGAFLVEKYSDIMPPAGAPPADLSITEIKAVVAYLQSLGGEITAQITEDDVAVAAARPKSSGGTSPAIELLTRQGCTTCHDLTGESAGKGPPLTTVANRLSPEEIRRSIVDPNAVIARGYAADLMPKTFAEDLEPEEIDMLVDHVVALAGPGGGHTIWAKTRSVATHPMLQLIYVIFLFNAAAWVAIEWLERG